MKISADKHELNLMIRCLLKGKVRINRITEAEGIEVEVDAGRLLPTVKLALCPYVNQGHGLICSIKVLDGKESSGQTLLSQGIRLAAATFGFDAAAMIAAAGNDLIIRESHHQIRLNPDALRRRFQLRFTPVISNLTLGLDHLILELKTASTGTEFKGFDLRVLTGR